MPLSSSPIASPPPSQPLAADVAAAGQLIPAIDRLKIMSESQWEDFVLEWAHSLKSRYADVQRCGGAGDMGRDVIATEVLGATDPWDNYQCKHYNHALQPGDVWIELGKLCFYTFKGEYTFPRNYWFVAPRGSGTKLSTLLRSPTKLKEGLLEHWEDHCRNNITSTGAVELDVNLKSHIEKVDFGIFKSASPLSIIEQHRTTAWHAARFGGGLKPRPDPVPPPNKVADSEFTYIRALLNAYQERLKCEISCVENLSDSVLSEHLIRSRYEFYSAEALREFSKENVPPGTFDSLANDVHNGVADVLLQEHQDGFARVLATIKQAKALSLASNALFSRIMNTDKGGICHQLANSSKIKWCK